MIRYLKFLLGHSLVNKGLYIAMFFAGITSCITYSLTVASQNDLLKNGLEFNVVSGLVSNFYQKVIMFISFGLSVIYSVVFISKADRKENFELTIISKGIKRERVILSKIVFATCLVLLLSVIVFTFLAIPVIIDDVMGPAEKAKWIFSALFGLICVGLIIMSTTLLISMFFEQLLSLIVSVVFMLMFPFAAIIAWLNQAPDYRAFEQKYPISQIGAVTTTNTDTEAVVQDSRLIYTQSNISGLPKVIKQMDLLEGTVTGDYNNIHTDSFNSFSRNDPWNSLNVFFSAFSLNKYNFTHTYKNMRATKLSDIVKPNEFNSVRFATMNYIHIPPVNYSKEHVAYYMNPLTEVGFVKKDANYYNDIVKIGVNFLKTHSQYISDNYKKFSFIEQCKVWSRFINHFDKDHDKPEQFFIHDAAYSKPLKPSHRQMIKVNSKMNNGFEMAKYMMDLDEKKYKSDRFADGRQDVFENGIYPEVEKIYIIEEKDCPTTYAGLIAWPFMALISVGLSIFIYMKRDIK